MKPQAEQLKILEGEERKDFISKLDAEFGIKNVPGILIMRGKERIFLFSGNLDGKNLNDLEKIAFVERAGVYFAKVDEFGVRLSIEGTHVIGNEIKRNIVELNSDEMETWMMGHELLKKTGLSGFVIIKYKDDFLGTGKASAEKIANFIPKSRRLRDRNVEN